jgi:hypothetical protein
MPKPTLAVFVTATILLKKHVEARSSSRDGFAFYTAVRMIRGSDSEWGKERKRRRRIDDGQAHVRLHPNRLEQLGRC